MSVETWKGEFYPTPADSPELDTDEKRILHSLKKFEGTRPEALRKHGVGLRRNGWIMGDIGDPMVFRFDGISCALCIQHLKQDCSGCPLEKQGDMCDSEEEVDPFSIFFDTGDPEPMIGALNKSLERARKE